MRLKWPRPAAYENLIDMNNHTADNDLSGNAEITAALFYLAGDIRALALKAPARALVLIALGDLVSDFARFLERDAAARSIGGEAEPVVLAF